MKVISIGRNYEIFDDNMQTHDRLPAQPYYLRFSQIKGHYLEAQSEIQIKEPKIYGVHNEKIEKVLNGFKRTNKNFGVILSGRKGIGKSLFAKTLAKTAIQRDYPVIIIDQMIPGLTAVLEDIKQEVVVLFDEFDKTFAPQNDDDDVNPQNALLSLFDGLSNGKKLFVVTCNDLNNLSDYLINRPGRFHYHFRFEQPTLADIDEYMKDKLDEKYWSEIPEVQKFSIRTALNYDCLSAIAFELNTGIPFKEAIKDLNIINIHQEVYNITLYFETGEILTKVAHLDMFQNNPCSLTLDNEEGNGIGVVTITPNKFTYDINTGCNILYAKDIKYNADPYYDDLPNYEKFQNLKPTHLTAERRADKNLHYLV